MSSTPVAAALERLGSRLTESDIAAVLLAEAPPVHAGVDTSSRHDHDIIVARSGLPREVRERVDATLDDRDLTTTTRQLVQVRHTLSAMADSMTSAEAQEALGLTRSGLSRRVSEGRVYAVSLGHRRVFPRWQFGADAADRVATLPRLAEIVPALGEAHPATVAGLMTTEQDELEGMTPVQWLISGGEPDDVVALADGLTGW